MVDPTAPQVSPRGTDRVRRRAAQAAAVVQSEAEGAALSPIKDKAEKAARIKRAKEADLARFGPTKATMTRARQTENRERADREAIELVSAPEPDRPHLVPGQQVDNLTARRLAKLSDREDRSEIEDAARAAGIAVRNTLKGRPLRDRHTRQRRIAQHNAKAALTAQS